MEMEHPVYRRDRKQLAVALELIRDWRDVHLLMDGCDPLAVTKTLHRALALDCMSQVSKRRSELLLCLKRWALSAFDWDIVMPTVTRSQPGTTRSFSARECRCILANAFFGNVWDTMAEYKRKRGGLLFWRMMRLDSTVAVHKTAALLLYFFAGMQLEGTQDDERKVEFCHLRGPDAADFDYLLRHNPNFLLDGKNSTQSSVNGCDETTNLKFGHVRLHSGRMEDVATPSGFVNFANGHFGYGKFIPSCTQEEIIQICCPEFNIGMLFLAVMKDNEVVNVYNCRRFCSYTGYLNTFRCTGPATTKYTDVPQIHHILTMDACFGNHYTNANVLRDTRKAYTAFKALADYTNRREKLNASNSASRSRNGSINGKNEKNVGMASVSTGKWGCGVFGGVPSHKLLQQVLAAKMAGVELHFSTFGNNESCDLLLAELAHGGETVSGAWELLLECHNKGTFERRAGIVKKSTRRSFPYNCFATFE